MRDVFLNNTGGYTRSYYTFTTLPTAASQQGKEAFITDANASPVTNHGQTAAGSGTYRARVLSDGTAWKLAK